MPEVNHFQLFTGKTCRKSCPLPGWKEYIQPLRDKSLFWHDIYGISAINLKLVVLLTLCALPD